MAILVGIPRETVPGEQRVALTPRALDVLSKSGVEFVMESSAGASAGFPDSDYQEKGVRVARSHR